MAKLKDSKVPKIRFKGFEAEWEDEQLGKIATFAKGQGYSKGDLTDSGTPIVLYGRLYVKYQTEISEVDTFVIEKTQSIKSTGKEVIVPASGETAEDIARASALRAKGIILGGDLNIIYPFDKLDTCFSALNLTYGKPRSELARRAQGKTVVHVRKADLESVCIFYPTPDEQTEIASYFRELDRLIGLQQRKHDKLVTLKTAMLQKMFPKPGIATPEIRFKGFKGDWDEKKLGEVCGPFEYGLNAAAKEYDGRNKYIRITDIDEFSGNFSQASLTTPDADLAGSANYLLSDGDILFARTGASVGKTYRYRQSDGRVFFAGFLIRARAIDPECVDFIFCTTLTSQYIKFVTMNSQRSGQPGINANEYSQFTFRAPAPSEQKKIGHYFRTLAELISKYAIQIEKLKQIKSACLEKMFV